MGNHFYQTLLSFQWFFSMRKELVQSGISGLPYFQAGLTCSLEIPVKSKKDLLTIEFKHSIFFFSLMRLLSPLYISLTVSISSDTIYNLALVSLISRLLFHNYSSGRYTAFSLNSGLFGSILLAGLHGRPRSRTSPQQNGRVLGYPSQNDTVRETLKRLHV